MRSTPGASVVSKLSHSHFWDKTTFNLWTSRALDFSSMLRVFLALSCVAAANAWGWENITCPMYGKGTKPYEDGKGYHEISTSRIAFHWTLVLDTGISGR